ncbi:hypothetical protein ACFL6O_06415 [candidate division KSB1 bacterium]
MTIKYRSVTAISFLILMVFMGNKPQSDTFPELKGPYLGQRPPGMIPQIFAPGIISTDVTERSSWFSRDGNTFVFSRWGGERTGIFVMDQKNGTWSKPEKFPHLDPEYDGDFLFSPDGNKLVFSSQRPLHEEGNKLENCHIYIMEKTEYGWQEPVRLGSEVNSGMHDSYPCLTADYTLYFFSRRSGGFGNADTYRSKFTDGKYNEIENLGKPVNTGYHDLDAFVAPDESYMILCSDRPGSYGEEDLYISFKKTGGLWTEPVNMGEDFNSQGSEWIPYVTPDGKYFFFTSNKTGNRDIYWVDAMIIEQFRPDKGK